jgi:hypothetical protein
MKIEELERNIDIGVSTHQGLCHDCGAAVEVTLSLSEEREMTISGGAIYKIKQGTEGQLFFKCDSCFMEDKTLRNFRRCEVYSRAVGYLRPVNQYNKGKKEEFKMRKVFKNTEGL